MASTPGRRCAALVGAALLAVLAGCTRPPPAPDPAALREIRRESLPLLEMLPAADHFAVSPEVPRRLWPRAIASLKPLHVDIVHDGVFIAIEADRGEGWGYFVPRDDKTAQAYQLDVMKITPLGEGVYRYELE
jgi:hypothetical protein